MAWPFSSRQSLSSAMAVVEDDEEEGVEEETSVHTAANPYCGNLSCWCHTDLDYHDQVTTSNLEDEVDEGLYERAMALLRGRQ